MPHYVYIIYSSKSDIYYKGYTTNPLQRLDQHHSSEGKYTSGKGPWELVYVEELSTKQAALKREKQLKRQHRKYLQWLIEQPLNQVSIFI